ncbi:MAG: hypothetical protein KTR15_05420 [Phycisphaeraceae bacterium]|nr:hypothetical protein [Phycisphaeraceae bacterium]
MDVVVLLSPVVVYLLYRFARYVWRCTRRARFEKGHFYCPQCRYDVSKAVDLRCTECGADVLELGVDHAEKVNPVLVGPLYFSAVLVGTVLAVMIFSFIGSVASGIEEMVYAAGLHHGWYDETNSIRTELLNFVTAGLVAVVYFGLPLLTLQLVIGHNMDIRSRASMMDCRFESLVQKNREQALTRSPHPSR